MQLSCGFWCAWALTSLSDLYVRANMHTFYLAVLWPCRLTHLRLQDADANCAPFDELSCRLHFYALCPQLFPALACHPKMGKKFMFLKSCYKNQEKYANWAKCVQSALKLLWILESSSKWQMECTDDWETSGYILMQLFYGVRLFLTKLIAFNWEEKVREFLWDMQICGFKRTPSVIVQLLPQNCALRCIQELLVMGAVSMAGPCRCN